MLIEKDYDRIVRSFFSNNMNWQVKKEIREALGFIALTNCGVSINNN